MLTQATAPILAYKVWEIALLNDNTPLMTPVNNGLTNNILGVSIATDGSFPAIISSFKRGYKPAYETFALSIDKLHIDKAKVTVDSNNLDQSLAHLPGSALPGEVGNVFISGHSNLFPFFSPADYYKSVFINLPKLKKGDEIDLQIGGQKLVYQVVSLEIVDPGNLSVIEPPDTMGRYLTLMTCVPPGINTKRLTVLAKLK